jgi:hypothetical protein
LFLQIFVLENEPQSGSAVTCGLYFELEQCFVRPVTEENALPAMAASAADFM